MKSKILLSSKSSGLCFNIMRLIILTSIAKTAKRHLVFLTKEDHIPVLKKFNKDCLFIPYVDNHTDIFNNFTRKRSLSSLYDLKYIKFINDTYVKNIFGDIRLSRYKFICGNIEAYEESDHKIIIMDYNDGSEDRRVLNLFNIGNFNVSKDTFPYDKSTITINVKINDPANKRIWDLWDEILGYLKLNYDKNILLISGNNEIKEYFGKKYGCLYKKTDTEVNFSRVRGNDIPRGKPLTILEDLITCSLTHFIPFTQIRGECAEICSRYTDINFVSEKEEKFDILALYLSKYVKVS